MKWTDKQVEKLKEMCYAGRSNEIIAQQIGCKLTDVYAKRSQLGITIDKCKAPVPKTVETKSPGLTREVKTFFNKLYDVLLLLIASDYIKEERAKKYSELYGDLLALESKYEKLLKG